jgi:hypothetical protein
MPAPGNGLRVRSKAPVGRDTGSGNSSNESSVHRVPPGWTDAHRLIGVSGLWVFLEVVPAIVAIEANVPDRGYQPRARRWISYTGAGRGCNVGSRSSPIGSEIARWSLARMLHFEEQRITAEAAEPVAQIHGCLRVLARPRKLHQQRGRWACEVAEA